MIQVLQLKGKDKHLYQLLAPLVMDPEVIRANNNYPFKTDSHFIWFIAVDKREVVGFIPVEHKIAGKAVINNYYIASENESRDEVLSKLLSEVIVAFCSEKWILDAVVLKPDQETFEKHDFSSLDQKWTRYVKMRK